MASGSFSKSFTSYGYKVIVDWESTPNTSTNSSVVVCDISLYIKYSLNTSQHDGSILYINGVQYPFTSPTINVSNGDTIHLATITSNSISHNADGSKSITIQCDYACNATISGTWYGTITASDTVDLDTIPRAASLTSAVNFTDEESPTITYNNDAGSSITLQAAIYDSTGSTAYAAYRNISATAGEYTFSLTSAEKNKLYAAIPDKKSMTVRFYLKSVIGSSNYYSYISKTFTIENANPTISPTIVDTNSTTIALTGDANKLIRYFSNAAITIGAAAIKGATLTSQKASVAGKSISTATGTIEAIESGTFTFTATDSRGNTTTKTVEKDCVEYVKLTCNFKPQVSVDGEARLTVSGNYYSGSFGNVSNTLKVYYRYKASDGDYGDWVQIEASGYGGTYSGSTTFTFENFNYKNSYTFQVYAEDELITLDAKTYIVSALPVCDWSSDDFKFNVPIILGNTKLTEEQLIKLLALIS